jgi:hypothetical protein
MISGRTQFGVIPTQLFCRISFMSGKATGHNFAYPSLAKFSPLVLEKIKMCNVAAEPSSSYVFVTKVNTKK